MTVLKKVSRAVCLSENAECHNCDGAIQHFKGLLPDGSAHDRKRPCPYSKDALVAGVAFLKRSAERGWHMRPDEPTKAMKEVGEVAWLEQKRADYIYRTMLAASPKFEWGQ